MKKIITIFCGALFILAGLAGLVLPIVPGWALIFVGMSMIAPTLAGRLRRIILRRFFKEKIVFFNAWRKAGVRAGFTTRHFPLALHKTAELCAPEHQNALVEALPSEKFVFLDQIHADRVEVIESPAPERFMRLEATDGVLTRLKNVTLLVMTADCLSVFFRTPGPDAWVGLVHAGWRGSRLGIAEKALRMICERSGCDPRRVQIAFGPCIGPACYEVGEEFLEFFPQASFKRRQGRLYFDLAAENRRRLISAGASPAHIEPCGICTVTDNPDFYSFRKEKDDAGRLISFIDLENPVR